MRWSCRCIIPYSWMRVETMRNRLKIMFHIMYNIFNTYISTITTSMHISYDFKFSVELQINLGNNPSIRIFIIKLCCCYTVYPIICTSNTAIVLFSLGWAFVWLQRFQKLLGDSNLTIVAMKYDISCRSKQIFLNNF